MADRLGDRRQTRSRSRVVDETPGSTNQTVEADQDPETGPVIRGRRSSRRISNQANIRDSSKSDSKSKSKREKRSRNSNSQGEPGPSSTEVSRTTKSRRVRSVFQMTVINYSSFYDCKIESLHPFASQGIAVKLFFSEQFDWFLPHRFDWFLPHR